jgi:hypothetical protein
MKVNLCKLIERAEEDWKENSDPREKSFVVWNDKCKPELSKKLGLLAKDFRTFRLKVVNPCIIQGRLERKRNREYSKSILKSLKKN